MPVRLITDVQEFASLRETWNALAGTAAFRRWEWMYSWAVAFRETTSLHILQVTDEAGQTIGYAPLHLQQSWKNGRCLRLLGDGKACGDDVSLITAPDRGEAVVDAVVDWLTSPEHRDTWDWMRLEGVTASDPLVRRLEQRLGDWGATPLRRDDLARWIIELPDDWEGFVARFGKNGRHHARSSRRKVETADSGFKLLAPTDETECLRLFESVRDMHERRWEGQEDGGCFSYPGFEAFLRAVVLQWFAEGSLYLCVLELNGKPLVGGIGVWQGDTLSLYLFGRDPDVQYNDVGRLLNYQTIREALERGAKKLDFLRGDEQYKGRLGAVGVPQALVQIANRGALNRVRYYATAGREAAKKLVGRKKLAPSAID